MTAGPHFLKRADEEGENESPDKNTQARPRKIIPEPYLRETHPEVHRSEGEIDQA